MNLLIVDDEIHIADSLADTIDWKPTGIKRVFKAYSASEALEVLHTEKVDIVVTDIRMPGMDGVALIERIRLHWSRMRLVLLTGYADFIYAKRALEQQVSAYLLKPIADKEILQVVGKLTAEIAEEWNAVISMKRTNYTVRENLPLIRHSLLAELLRGRKYADEDLENRLIAYRIPIRCFDSFVIFAIRLEEGFVDRNPTDRALYEYAVCNIAGEIIGEEFSFWSCKDAHELLVFLAVLKEGREGSPSLQMRLSELAIRIQQEVKDYLHGNLSVVIGKGGVFPRDVPPRYREILAAMRRAVGDENNMIFSDEREANQEEIPALHTLYEHPTLLYLLEAGSWDLVRRRLTDIFEEIEHKWSGSPEPLFEVMGLLVNAFSYAAHRTGKTLTELAPEESKRIYEGSLLHSSRILLAWAENIIDCLRRESNMEMQDSRSILVQKAQQFIVENLHQDLALQTVADHVHLHPVYLSRIFKIVTKENLSEYIHRLRMEKAGYLLMETDFKVYEITEKVGYENPQYFSKVFRKHYGVTPLEYRNATNSSKSL